MIELCREFLSVRWIWLYLIIIKWLWVRIPLLSLTPQIWCLLRARSFLIFRQNYRVGFTLELVRDMIITYSQMHRTDENSQHSLIIWLVLLNGWAFVYELSGCGFESRCCLMYTNADLKISLFDLLYIKMMPWKFRILNLNISRVNL